MAVARELGDVDLVSVDSMQVYRGMDVGTAKPSARDRAEVRHHLLDLVDPTEEFTVAEFRQAYDEALLAIGSAGRRALLVGGTGLYHRVVVDEFDLPGQWPELRAELEAEPDTAMLFARLSRLDPAAAEKMEPSNRRRVVRALEVTLGSGRPFSSFGPGVDEYPPSPVAQVGLRWPREVLTERIAARVHEMVTSGLFDEVAGIEARGGFSRTAAQALGYKETLDALAGRIGNDEAIDTIITRTRQFAVRQERWFRRDPRVRWIDIEADAVVEATPVVLDAFDT
jgi:tRNA dimethylallyltransferase